MKLNERIQLLRTQNDLTQKELSDLIGVSVVSISGWENGSRNPSADALISLSKVFHVTTDHLLGISFDSKNNSRYLSRREETLLSNYRMLDIYGKNAVDAICTIEKSRLLESESASLKIHRGSEHSQSARYIPRYSTPAAAGSSVPLDGADFKMILVDDSIPGDADFAVRIQGNSMYPYIADGDTVYVRKTEELSVGDVGIFCVNGEMYCKQYYVDDNRNLMLVSANPDLKHTNVCVTADSGANVKCYGKVLLGRNISLPDYIR